MKKVLTISLLVVLVLTFATTLVRAAEVTEADLQKNVLEVLAKVDTGVDYTATVERVFNEYDFTSDQMEIAMTYVEKIRGVVEANGSDPKAYVGSVKTELVGYAQSAAEALGMKLTVDYNDKVATLTKGGKTVVAVNTENGKILQTGSENLVYVVLAGVAIIAVVATVVVKRARANA